MEHCIDAYPVLDSAALREQLQARAQSAQHLQTLGMVGVPWGLYQGFAWELGMQLGLWALWAQVSQLQGKLPEQLLGPDIDLGWWRMRHWRSAGDIGSCSLPLSTQSLA